MAGSAVPDARKGGIMPTPTTSSTSSHMASAAEEPGSAPQDVHGHDLPAGPILVTGVCGFIGSHVAVELLRRGAAVIGVDTRPLNRPGRPGDVLSLLQTQPQFRMVRADVRAPEVAEAVQGTDAVIHLAAATDVGASWGEGFTDHAFSVLATQRLLDACIRHDVQRVVVASSAHVYGPATSGEEPVRESDPTEPTSPYGVAKLAAERLALAYARRPGSQLSTVALRFFPAFGPGCNPQMVIPRFFTAALTGEAVPLFGDGTARHTWTYISDLVEAAVRAVAAPLPPGGAEVVNAAGCDAASLRQVAEMVGQIVGRPVPLRPAGERPGDAVAVLADVTRAGRVLGFVPSITLPDGLERHWNTTIPNSVRNTTKAEVTA
ncbi:NAD-dependent epimerase/dehydratase family protein [Actinomadura coerulea]|uniref:NAD-dependent epimerase/dehydratase family protein n=1 Tax=Actinomadura coerulea TaxID=46159 RepID=UPI003441D101